jgi:hypothetical protein
MFSFNVCNTNEVKSPLVDARFQVESGTWANGFTVAYAASAKSDDLTSAFIFLHGLLVNEIIPASSARFPCLNIQSRDRSPPRFKVLSHLQLGEKETYFLSPI